MADIVLILGGVRSGKSRFAQQLAQRVGGDDDVLFVATATAGDEEMTRRIQIHRSSRPVAWQTVEAATAVGDVLQQVESSHAAIVIDCLTILVSNVLLSFGETVDFDTVEVAVNREVQLLLEACTKQQGTVIIVSGEVGMGVVPTSSLGRSFRDLLGWANQTIASQARSTYWMIAGHAVEVSTISHSVDQAAAQLCTRRDWNRLSP